jgi:hypothetical protein
MTGEGSSELNRPAEFKFEGEKVMRHRRMIPEVSIGGDVVNHFTKKFLRILAVGLVPIALSLTATSVHAQNPQARSGGLPQAEIVAPRAEVIAEPVQALITPDLFRVNKRSPIQFKAFDMLDPTTGKPVSRDTLLPELPNGRRLTAGQYYDELNKLEQQLNAMGHSLRTAGEAKVELQTTPVPVAALERQARIMKTAHMANTRFEPLDLRAIELEHRSIVADPKLLTLTLAPTAKTVQWTKNWNKSLGDPNVFSAFINGKIDLNGTKDLTRVDGEATAGGSIFSQSFDLLRVTGNLNAPSTGTINVKVGVSVVGISVYNLNQNVSAAWSKSDSISKTLDKSVKIKFNVGPVPMSAKIGAQGTAGITYAVAVAPVKASAHVGPFVHTKVYAQVGVDIVIAGAGAGADLTLLNTDGNLEGALSIEIDSTNRPYFKWTDSYSQSLDMLSGQLYVYAYVYYPCFNPWWKPNICKKEYDWNIFPRQGGFHASGNLFKDAKILYLY